MLLTQVWPLQGVNPNYLSIVALIAHSLSIPLNFSHTDAHTLTQTVQIKNV